MTLQNRIQSLLDQLTANGTERGLQFCAYHNGKLLVDAASGVLDRNKACPVTTQTLFPVFSVSKGMTATLAHQAVERGLITYDTLIATVWPEFATNGKEKITLRQALTHTAGLPHMPTGIGFAELCDWTAMCRAIAALTPSWTPGTRLEYHAMTFGWIVGETIRRVTGAATFQQLLKQNISDPLALDGLYIGMPEGVTTPVAIIDEPAATTPSAPEHGRESVPAWMGPLYAIINRADMRRACLPASSGVMNAHSIAKHYAALIPGGVEDVELLPLSRVKLAAEPQRPDHPEGDYEKNWGLGYKTNLTLGTTFLPSLSHGGYGGSQGFVDLEAKLAVGFTKNLFAGQDTFNQIMTELRSRL